MYYHGRRTRQTLWQPSKLEQSIGHPVRIQYPDKALYNKSAYRLSEKFRLAEGAFLFLKAFRAPLSSRLLGSDYR